MEYITSALTLGPAAVLVATELLKLIPVQFTSKYPAWVNAIVSVIGAVIVVQPSFDLVDMGALAGTALYLAVVSAWAYNNFAKKLKEESV